jgi:hypothetical protein
MIASFLHNFIFIKTRKTAGTAVETVLASVCGPDDIITPLGIKDEVARCNPDPICRNFATDPALEAAIRKAVRDGKRRSMRGAKTAIRKADFYNHISAAEIRAKLPPAFWTGAHKFTVERHPYEKAVSQAYFNYAKDEAFEPYLDRFIRKGRYTSFELYSIDGEVVVSEFLRQETLEDDLRRMAARLNLPLADEIPRNKSGSRADRRPAREILTDAQKEIVYGFCRKEFELLGYDP